jgi:hypothetical protein
MAIDFRRGLRNGDDRQCYRCLRRWTMLTTASATAAAWSLLLRSERWSAAGTIRKRLLVEMLSHCVAGPCSIPRAGGNVRILVEPSVGRNDGHRQVAKTVQRANLHQRVIYRAEFPHGSPDTLFPLDEGSHRRCEIGRKIVPIDIVSGPHEAEPVGQRGCRSTPGGPRMSLSGSAASPRRQRWSERTGCWRPSERVPPTPRDAPRRTCAHTHRPGNGRPEHMAPSRCRPSGVRRAVG